MLANPLRRSNEEELIKVVEELNMNANDGVLEDERVLQNIIHELIKEEHLRETADQMKEGFQGIGRRGPIRQLFSWKPKATVRRK